ncbi:RHS repeat protein [Massilia sp. YMA4]|uniref:RHS repeat protein n=1 Tax=Massilia sp. YMA4 TaxID=1593482 RepID=UPI000DD13212|nr:RHS repeat protein [Massilia sp. YMA4]AXA91169.1 hypothetical protein DPH57_08365 [Massilia sp. YMA4]
MTKLFYDPARILETRRIEAAGTKAERIITTEWHPSFRIPANIAEPKLTITFKHDASGNVLSRIEQATTDETGRTGMQAPADGPPRKWTYTYHADGKLKSVSGPRTDVGDITTYTYDSWGNPATATDALGHVTRYSEYDANGRVGRIDAPNGTWVTLAYSERGWLRSRTEHGGEDALHTQFDYDGVGLLKKVTLPDGNVTEYEYDDAHRLYRVSDSAGNQIVYTLDLTGNRIREQARDPDGALARQLIRVYDVTGKLTSETGAYR